VLSVDKKTAIQAKERAATPTNYQTRGVFGAEFEYRRPGTVSLMAALDVHGSEVLARDIARNDAATFCDFHGDIDRAVDVAMEIHLVMDNGSSHTAKTTKACLDARPRFVAHYTPPHASWARPACAHCLARR
jgi:hypothetical protein